MKARSAVGLSIAILILISLLAGAGVWLVRSLSNALEPRLAVGCTATVSGSSYSLSTEQARNAALISEISVQRGMPPRAASIALATALQESALRNIPYGDLDSVGLFQQRPSQDWGTVEQIMDPLYSANAFYNVLEKVPGYLDMSVNDAAQTVQRSGFPEAYAQHEALARAFASALTGETAGGFSCTLPEAAAAGLPDGVTAGAQEAMSGLDVLTPSVVPGESGTIMTFDVAGVHGWMLAHWAVANALELGIVEVSHAGQTWDRSDNKSGSNVGWQPSDIASTEQVVITVMAAS